MTALLIFSLLLFLAYAGLLIYYRQGWISTTIFQPKARSTTKMTVIVPARNEAENIGHCLNSIQQQTYPNDYFEVIVVDDHSEDDTAEIISGYGGNIRCINLSEHLDQNINSYKKKAIEVGIENASGQLIVTTDADTFLQPNWLRTIASFYEERKPVFIAAPVLINCNNSLFQQFQTLDFMVMQGITGAAVQKQFHNMCNGANLAYEKSAFAAVNRFEGIDNIASGDDMLLMHKIEQRFPGKIMYLKSKDAIVVTDAAKTMKEFFSQRIRWASKADKYGDKTLFPVLLLVYLFNLLMLTLPIFSIFLNIRSSIFNFQFSILLLWITLLVLKTIVELLFLYPVAEFFDRRKMLWLFPLMQPFHIVYTVIAGWLGKFGSYQWKGRQVK